MSLALHYEPIACILHERLEFAVLKRLHLQVQYLDSVGLAVVSAILPLDVYSGNAAEWLKMQHADGQVETIRLDALLTFSELV